MQRLLKVDDELAQKVIQAGLATWSGAVRRTSPPGSTAR